MGNVKECAATGSRWFAALGGVEQLVSSGGGFGTAVAVALAAFVVSSNWSSISAALPDLPESVTWPTAVASGSDSSSGSGLKPSVSEKAARKLLAGLGVVERPKAAVGYSRAAFGTAWADVDGNGCNQRDDVLLRDVDKTKTMRKARQGGCDHDMLAGTWNDPYTGKAIVITDAKNAKQAASVQIDHVVPLQLAWRYGADQWTAEKRLRFANDLSNLLAVDGAANASKGAQDAAAWRPKKTAQCGYATRYIVVKDAYGLPVDTSEKRALTEMLDTCR